MKVLFFGNRERGCLCLEAVVKAGHEVIGVVTLPRKDQPFWCRSMILAASDLGISAYFSISENFDAESFKEYYGRPDVVILAGWPKLVGEEIINLPTKMCINLHASPLPRYRGPHPLNWMLIRGEQKGGISIIEVDKGVDTGPILAQELFDISPHWNYKDLLDYTLQRYPKLLVETLEKIEAGIVRKRKQYKYEGFWCSKRVPDDGIIEWETMRADDVHNLSRALVYPMPGARVSVKDTISKSGDPVNRYAPYRIMSIEKTRLMERTYIGVPGRIVAHLRRGVVVLCKDRGLLVEKCRDIETGIIYPATEVLGPTGSYI